MRAIKAYIVLLLCLLSSTATWAHTFTGTVTDSITGETLPFISIRIANTMYGDETDLDGNFSINAEETDRLEFTFLGYKTKTYSLNKYVNRHMNVKLVPTDYMLQEVQVTTKNNYSKKNNPAVELAKRILAEKNENRIERADYYQRSTYEKLLLGITDIKSGKTTDNLGLGEIMANADTSIISGKNVLMVSLKEKTMQQYYRKSPETKKQIVTGRKEKGIDDQLF
ncbi:MAG: carboxypeptidase-like regulatory domain-containing protein, partial [Paludibacteraceae bacterium]|nr:carboxypeptidase-like regulatory domain-containing protein [Paludibacteraceae bacterium]